MRAVRMLQKICYESCPASLVACSQAAARVAVKVLIELRVGSEARVAREEGGRWPRPINGSDAPAPRVRAKETEHACREVVRGSAKSRLRARARWKLDSVCATQTGPQVAELLDEEVVEGEPDWPAPVGVGAKQRHWRLCWGVFDGRLEAAIAAYIARGVDAYREISPPRSYSPEVKGRIAVLFAQAPDAVRREELVLIEHAPEDARELI